MAHSINLLLLAGGKRELPKIMTCERYMELFWPGQGIYYNPRKVNDRAAWKVMVAAERRRRN